LTLLYSSVTPLKVEEPDAEDVTAENVTLMDHTIQRVESAEESCSAVASSAVLTAKTTAAIFDVPGESVILAEKSADSREISIGLTVYLNCTAEDSAGNMSDQLSLTQPSIEELSSSESVPFGCSSLPSLSGTGNS